jgi:biotin transport system substrate-specific component
LLYIDKSTIVKLSFSISLIIFTGVFAQIRFFLPDNPVPITFQTLGILLMGGLLGPRWGLGTSLSYVILGLAGIPLFQGGNGGFQYSTGATGGYIIGFVFASTSVGYFINKGLNESKSIWAYIMGTLIVYIPAIIWLSIFNFSWPEDGKLFSQAVYPFLIGDIIKAIAASLLTIGILKTKLNKYLK